MNDSHLAAIKVERRSIGVAVFIGNHLDYTEVRHLSSTYDKAEVSAVSFVNWVIGNFGVQAAALEDQGSSQSSRRLKLTQAIVKMLRANSRTAISEVGKQEVLRAFALPAVKTRRQVREIVSTIWPVLPSQRDQAPILDATALGLYVQTKRKLS